MKKNYILAILMLTLQLDVVYSQVNYSTNPLDAQFIVEDVERFWLAFDSLESSPNNPFESYIEKGSLGVKGFTEYRIINADSLLNKVKANKKEYLKSRYILDDLDSKEKELKAAYAALKYWYPPAEYPPVYFVVGRFNSGGTVSEDGIIIGVEKLENLDGLVGLIAHELIHFQQKYDENNVTLLNQALIEGSADFISELITGKNINATAFSYGELNEISLKREFQKIMGEEVYIDWLYETSQKDSRPNDLGYWIGYNIVEAYWNKQKDKKKAINNILNIKDAEMFAKTSGYFD